MSLKNGLVQSSDPDGPVCPQNVKFSPLLGTLPTVFDSIFNCTFDLCAAVTSSSIFAFSESRFKQASQSFFDHVKCLLLKYFFNISFCFVKVGYFLNGIRIRKVFPLYLERLGGRSFFSFSPSLSSEDDSDAE